MPRRRRLPLWFLLFAAPFPAAARADVRLPRVFGPGMVLQRDRPVAVWGWANPGEKVTATIGASTASATANDAGEWKLNLPAMRASETPASLAVSGSNRVVFDDVLVGDVWLCSGQSNMEFGLGMTRDADREVAAADVPGLRLLLVQREWKPTPVTDIAGEWKHCTPASVVQGGWNGFSAVGYFFGRELHRELGVPIGLIEASWGGTRIESWTPPAGFASVPALREASAQVASGTSGNPEHDRQLLASIAGIDAWSADAKRAVAQGVMPPPVPTLPPGLLGPDNVQASTALYNGSIHPICPYTMRGAIWYQGESNETEGPLYAERMKALVNGWRAAWGQGDFPFYFVQIAPYDYGSHRAQLPELWEAQSTAEAAIPHAGMVVTNDIGNLHDIHPTNKQDVGHRLAIRALTDTYGQSDRLGRSPTFKSLATDGDALRVTFDHAGTGLASRDGKALGWFEIAGQDSRGYRKATARIDGASLLLTAPGVTRPTAVRFAWNGLAEPNLVNSAGLPASAFRAGAVPLRDGVTPNVPELKGYTLVYDMDLAAMAHDPRYTTDAHAAITRPFDRVAYALELETDAGDRRWVYASMDAFTDDPSKLGIPTAASGASFQRNVAHLNVFSNAPGVTTGTDLPGGNIEFWPNNYEPRNAAAVPGASDGTFDFGDRITSPTDGYGSMQVHNHDARQTLFAINHWTEGDQADLGIGNAPAGNPDWTFAKNAGAYPTKRLRVFVKLR